MAIKIEIEMNNKIRKDIAIVAKQSGDDIMNFVFNRGSVTLLGYTNSSFCLCKEYINCDIDYSFRVQSGIVLSMINYAYMGFDIELKTVTIKGFDKEHELKRQAQLRINVDTTANYQADLYNGIIGSLRNGFDCNSLDSLREFYKISKVNPKAERGVVISNNQFYTCGPGYKYYAKTKMGFNCFVISEDLIALVEFVGDEDNIIYESGGYIVAKNRNDCYFGIRVSDPPEGIRDLETIMMQKPSMSFTLPIHELKTSIKSIKSEKTNDGKITFLPAKGQIVVGLKSVVYVVPIVYNDYKGEQGYGQFSLNFKLFNRLLQTMSVNLISSFRVYNNFVSLTASDNALLLIGKD